MHTLCTTTDRWKHSLVKAWSRGQIPHPLALKHHLPRTERSSQLSAKVSSIGGSSSRERTRCVQSQMKETIQSLATVKGKAQRIRCLTWMQATIWFQLSKASACPKSSPGIKCASSTLQTKMTCPSKSVPSLATSQLRLPMRTRPPKGTQATTTRSAQCRSRSSMCCTTTSCAILSTWETLQTYSSESL